MCTCEVCSILDRHKGVRTVLSLVLEQDGYHDSRLLERTCPSAHAAACSPSTLVQPTGGSRSAPQESRVRAVRRGAHTLSRLLTP